MSSTEEKFEKIKDPLPKKGEMINGFTIDTVVGQGNGMITYRANTPEGQEVALKILRPKFAKTPIVLDMVAMEADVLRAVAHPVIPQFIAFGAHGVIPYVVQSLGLGGDLGDLLRKKDREFLPRVIRAVLHVCDALEALHAKGIIHRDVKLSNILVDSDTRDTVTLVDFGGCQFIGRGEGKDEAIGRIGGTVETMSPEMANDAEACPATDTYSVAAMLRYIVYGTYPIGDKKMFENEFLGHIKAGNRNPFPPLQIDRDLGVPAGFRELIERGTAYEVKERYQSASALADALRPFA